MKQEFVVVKQNNSKYPEEYVGVVDGRTKDTISIVCVDASDDTPGSIQRRMFELDGFKVRVVKQDVVRRAFDHSMLNLNADLAEAKTELSVCEHRLGHSTALFTEVFKK